MRRSISSSRGGNSRRASFSEQTADIVRKADVDPYQLITDPAGKKKFVLLTHDHYEELREALHSLQGVLAALDPDAETVSFEEMTLKAAGADLAKARKAKGWTQAKLARKTGVPQSQISRIERNPDRTTIRTMRKLAKALGVDVRQLIKP